MVVMKKICYHSGDCSNRKIVTSYVEVQEPNFEPTFA